MEPNDTMPSQTPASDPLPPTEQPVQPPLQPTDNAPKKSKSMLIIVLAVVAVLIIGAGAYYFFVVKDSGNKTANNNTDTETADTTETTQEESTTKTTSFASPEDGSTVSVTHPKDWDVNTDLDEEGLEQVTIKSPKGNYLHLYQNLGVGGTCEPDTYSYTLVKRLATQDPNYVFSEYTTTDLKNPLVKFSLEPIDHATDAHKALKEGEGGTDLCSNLFYYPIAGDHKDIFVKIDRSPKADSTTAITYDMLKDDTEFIAMLESFKVSADN